MNKMAFRCFLSKFVQTKDKRSLDKLFAPSQNPDIPDREFFLVTGIFFLNTVEAEFVRPAMGSAL
jgi:hypothetical protein